MKNTRMVLWMIGLTAVMTISCLGCGKKGDPTPVEMKRLQQAVTLKVEKTAGAVSVRWPNRPVSEPRSVFKVERRAIDPEATDCRYCPKDFDAVAEIEAAGPFCKKEGDRECLYTDGQVKAGWQYSYQLSICDEAGRCEAYASTVSIIY